jgi:uncharacterized protein (UPF0333 family)
MALFYIKNEKYREENISSKTRVSGTGSTGTNDNIIFIIEYNGDIEPNQVLDD